MGVLLVAAAVVALVLALTGGDDEDDRDRARGPGTVELSDPRFGVQLRHPRTWQRVGDGRAIRLVSPDRRVGISLSTVASRTGQATATRPAVERSVLEAYDPARILDRGNGTIGGRTARLSAIRGRNERGEAIDVLVATVASRWRTYAVVSFGSPQAPQDVLRQAESIIASMRFVRPGRGG